MCIAIQYFLLRLFPFHHQALVGLPAAIGPHAVLQVCLSQIGNIHEGHSTHIEAEHEDVAGKSHSRVFWQFKVRYHFQLLLADCSFGCLDV